MTKSQKIVKIITKYELYINNPLYFFFCQPLNKLSISNYYKCGTSEVSKIIFLKRHTNKTFNWEKRKFSPNPVNLTTKLWKTSQFFRFQPSLYSNVFLLTDWLGVDAHSPVCPPPGRTTWGVQVSPSCSVSPWEKAASLVRLREGTANVSSSPSFFQSDLS